MSISFITSYRVDDILAELDKAARIDERGSVGFTLPVSERWIPVLISAVEFQPRLPQIAAHDIVHSALFAAAASPPITKDTLHRSLKRAHADYLAKPLAQFILLTQLSTKLPLPPRRVRWCGAVVRFSPSPGRYLIAVGDRSRA